MNPGAPEKAHAGDIASILRIEEMCFTYDAWPAKTFESEIPAGLAGRSTVVRDCRGEAVAYCVSRILMNEAQVFKIAVHPLHRRRGLAKALLRDVMERSERVTLEVAAGNTAAISLYMKMGFRKTAVRENYYRGGRDAVVMQAGGGAET